MHRLWLVAVFCLFLSACAGEKPELRSSYLLVTGPHRYPVTLNFDEESGQYWGLILINITETIGWKKKKKPGGFFLTRSMPPGSDVRSVC